MRIKRRRQCGQWLAGLNINDEGLQYFRVTDEDCLPRSGARGRNMSIILAINQETGLVQCTPPTLAVWQFTELHHGTCQSSARVFPGDNHIHIIFDGARPHLNVVVPKMCHERFTLHMLSLGKLTVALKLPPK